MTDCKGPAALAAARVLTPALAAQREAAIGVALSGVLLSDLTRIICDYQCRPHRFDAASAPKARVTVSADGLSAEIVAQVPAPDISPFVVWSAHTLGDGAQHWSVRFPVGLYCWIGVGDVRTRDDESGVLPDMVYAGHWVSASVNSYSTIQGPRTAVNAKVAFTRAQKLRWQPTVVVHCTFDDATHTLRMEIAGEPDAGELVAPLMPAAEFLCPIVMFNRSSLREANVLTIESEEE
jgi:hypothetical protein